MNAFTTANNLNNAYSVNADDAGNAIEGRVTPTTSVLFIDSRVPDLQQLINAAQPGTRVVILQSDQDGVQQMADALQGMSGLESISLISHGDSGVLLLGNGPLFAGNLDAHAAQLAAIGNALAADGDLLLYGCDVGAGPDGVQFVNALAALTSADVAASDDDTGAQNVADARGRSGDWDLEITSGTIDHAPAINVQALGSYDHLLITTSVSTRAGLQTAINAGNTDGADDIITLTGSITFASASDTININVTDGKTMTIVGGSNTLNGNNLTRVLSVNSSGVGSKVVIDNLTITNGFLTGAGGNSGSALAGGDALGAGINNAGTLTITNSSITLNKAAGGGGGGGYTGGNGGAGGGGGGGFGTTLGGAGGTASLPGTAVGNASAGVGAVGQGYGTGYTPFTPGSGGGRGGSTTGGAGGSYVGYSSGGNGGTASNGSISIGGGGGGVGGNTAGGRGGMAVGGIYNTGTLTITGSTVTNNIGAGGGGGAGSTVGGFLGQVSGAGGAGGAGGSGTGGIANVGGTLNLDATTNTSLSTGNAGGAGTGGVADFGGATTGATGTATITVATTGGTTNTNFDTIPPVFASAAVNGNQLVMTYAEATTLDATNKAAVGAFAVVSGGSANAVTLVTVNAAVKTITLTLTTAVGPGQVVTVAYTDPTGGDDANATQDAAGNDAAALGVTAVTNNTIGINSATYNASTGTLVVTGGGMTTGDTIDVTKLSLSGQGGTYTLTAATLNPNASGSTSFTVTLGAADKIAVNGVLNNNGTSAVDTTVFNLAAALNWNVPKSAAADATGNGVTVSNVAAPTIQSASYNANTGLLSVTGTGLVKTIGGANDITVNTLRIVGEGGTGRTLVISSNVEITNATSFSVQLSGNDRIVADSLLNKNGTVSTSGSTYNVIAFDDWNSVVTNGDIADATNPLTVTNVPAPSITSATYDATTGTLLVTGTGFLQLTGVNNDVVANKFTLTGEGGSTYTLTDTPPVDIATTSNTQFTLVLSATDKSGVNQIINKNGSASTGITTYNLAAAEDWAAGADAAVVVADLSGNGITTSNVAVPTISTAGTTYDAATGTLVVAGTGFLKLSGLANDIDVSKLSMTGEGGIFHTLTSIFGVEITSDTSFTVVLNATDRNAVNQLVNRNGGSSTDVSTYTLRAAEDWAAGADAAVTVADLTGNAFVASNVAVPTITSATFNASTGALVVTGTGLSKLTGATNDIDVSKLSIVGEGGASYALTTTGVEITDGVSFSVTLNATDLAAVNLLVNQNGGSSTGGTTYNLAAAEDWARGADAGVTVADLMGNGITASGVAVPTITSATYDAATGALVATGTGMSRLNGLTNDIVANKFTFTGQGGSSYALTDTANVEVTSGTSFTLTLSTTDRNALDGLLNKNGSTSIGGTTYNLAAAEDWAAGADAAVVIADLAGNGITVSNAALPTLTSATYDANTGVLSVTGTRMTIGDTIVVGNLSLTGQGGSYPLTTVNTTATSDTAFSVTLNAADKLVVNGLLNNNGTTSVGATAFNLAGAAGWDSTAGAPADLTGNAVTVSNVAAPTITSATFDGATNIFTVTGTNLVRAFGATNDITIGSLTITGEGGATSTLSTTGNVEVTSATSFTFTLAGADIAAVSALLNKNGSTSASATVYNIAAADDWNSVITGGDIADLTLNPITVANAAPSILSATYNAATGVLSVSALNIATNDVIDVTKLSVTGQGGSYTLNSNFPTVFASSTTGFSVTLNPADRITVNGILNNNGTSSVAATTFNLAAAAGWDVTTASAADATNAVTVSSVAAPIITSATYDAGAGTLNVTGTGLVRTVGATNDITVSKLTLTGEGGSTVALTSTDVEINSDTSFTVTLNGADKAAFNQIANKNGASSTGTTTYNLAAADDWNSVITGGNIAVTTSAITVSNVPVPTVTNATYYANTGVLVVTATGLSSLNGAANDIVANKFSLQGEGGASYTLSTTSSVEITSATSFTLTLSAADRLGANLILNKNGLSSTSVNTYNLIAAEDWAAGAAAAVVIADLTGNGITVTNVVAPTVTSATYDVATGVLVVTGNNFLSLAGANNDITANRIRFLGQGAFNYTLTDTANVDVTSNTSFSMTMSATDKAQLALRLNKDGTSSTDTTTYNIGLLEDWNAGAAVAVVIADLFGNPVTVIGNDITAPVFASASVNGNQLTLTYTDANNLDAANPPAIGAFAVVTGAANPVTAVAVNAAAKTVVLTLTTAVVFGQTGITVAYTDPTAANDANAIQDASGNDATTLAATAVTNATPDTTAPVFANAVINANQLVLTYTDLSTLDAVNAPAVGAFAVKVDGATNVVTGVAVNAAAKTVTLTLTTAVAFAQAVTVTVAYTDPTGGNDLNAIQDAAGNDAITLAATAVTNVTPDTTAPSFASATVNANQLVMTYTDLNTLDAVNTPAAGTFTVKVGGATNPVTGVSVNATAKTVTLTLTAPVVFGQTVTVAYTDPTAGNDANAIQDAAGNDAATLATTTVTNNTAFVPNSAGTGIGAVAPDNGGLNPAQQGDTLSINTTGLTDPDGLGPLSYQWLRDGQPITGATADKYTLGAGDVGSVMTVAISYTDGAGYAERSVSSPTQRIQDNDGIDNAIESQVPALTSSGIKGDGNGDGTQDVVQLHVTSGTAPGTTSYFTLVADSNKGLTDVLDTNQAILSQVKVGAAPVNLPNTLSLNALLSFKTDVGTAGTKETFSIFVDAHANPNLNANGYWVKDKSGTWNNIATATETVGSKIRIDFAITDGGAFDADGLANGSIDVAGGAGQMQLSIVGQPADVPPAGFWF